jgi:hypothetical protein
MSAFRRRVMKVRFRKVRKRAILASVAVFVLSSWVGACSPSEGAGVDSNLFEPPIVTEQHETTPIRGATRALAYTLDGDSFPCSTCHEGFEGEMTTEALADTHSNIEFDHGRNVRCLNCHNPVNADAYVNHDGSEIPGDEPTLLCAKCHGPHYREWTLDVHGRVNKYWDKRFGEQEKLDCIQCHDPHRPRFPPMTPKPPPVLTRFDLNKTKGAHHE